MEKYSLASVGKDLRQSMDSHGLITSHEVLANSSGDRALVIVNMDAASFDMHLRVDENGKLLRDTWMPHKKPSNQPSSLSESDRKAHLQRYVPVIVDFMETVRAGDAAKLKSLFSESEDDEWTVEQYQEMIDRFERRGELLDYGPVEVATGADACFPAFFEEMAMALEFCISIDTDSKIVGLRLSNYAPVESEGKSLADIGADTLRTSDLTDMDALARQFMADSGKVRFVTLLSPT